MRPWTRTGEGGEGGERGGEIAEHGELPRGPSLGRQDGGDADAAASSSPRAYPARAVGFIFTSAKIQPELPDAAGRVP